MATVSPSQTTSAPSPVFVGAQTGAELERGPHHRILESIAEYRAADGTVVRRTNQITVLATGMFYESDGQWLETREEIELLAEHAVARSGPHRAIWPRLLAPDGLIDVVTADGQRFRSRVLGLSYYDASSGQSVLFAEFKGGLARLASANRLVYADAFEGARADLVYVYRRAGLAQEVVLRSRPPGPDSFGLEPALTDERLLDEPEMDDSSAGRARSPLRAVNHGGPARPRRAEDCAPYLTAIRGPLR